MIELTGRCGTANFNQARRDAGLLLALENIASFLPV